MCLVFVNGEWIANTLNTDKIIKTLRTLRRSGNITFDTSISFDDVWNEIHIWNDHGRLCRPLFVCESNNVKITKEHLKLNSWDKYIQQGLIEYIDKEEEENLLLIWRPSEKKEGATHCEIHPSLMYGVNASIIPFSNHNQSPRNSYQTAMGKQAIGLPFLNFQWQMSGNFFILNYPQLSLAETKMSKIIGYDSSPTGQNAIVAICPFFGCNQEDSIVLNRSSVERGFMKVTKYIHFYIRLRKEKHEEFGIPTRTECGKLSGNPIKLKNSFCVSPGDKVEKGDILVGMICKSSNAKQQSVDCSLVYDEPRYGVVEKVQMGTDGEDYDYVRISVLQQRNVEIGDKLSSRHGQKGTCGAIFDAVDLPFSQSGIIPDILVNPLGYPSRMTLAQLIESITGKLIASPGEKTLGEIWIPDATPFSRFELPKLQESLKAVGLDPSGEEIMYDGITGAPLKSMIFMGSVYYQRLKHMSQDKIHSRSSGPKSTLTRQPLEGRSSNGGLRCGTMERDCLLGQGAVSFVVDRMMDQSDVFEVYVCNICGIPAVISPTESICKICGKNSIKKIKIPYGAFLLIRELAGFNIITRICTSAF